MDAWGWRLEGSEGRTHSLSVNNGPRTRPATHGQGLARPAHRPSPAAPSLSSFPPTPTSVMDQEDWGLSILTPYGARMARRVEWQRIPTPRPDCRCNIVPSVEPQAPLMSVFVGLLISHPILRWMAFLSRRPRNCIKRAWLVTKSGGQIALCDHFHNALSWALSEDRASHPGCGRGQDVQRRARREGRGLPLFTTAYQGPPSHPHNSAHPITTPAFCRASKARATLRAVFSAKSRDVRGICLAMRRRQF